MKIVFPPRPDLPSLGPPGPVSQSSLPRPVPPSMSHVAAHLYAALIVALERDLGHSVTVRQLGPDSPFFQRELARQRACFPTRERGGMVVVVAHDYLGTLPHDEFQIRFKRLLECQLEVFEGGVCHRTYRTVSPDYYPHPAWNDLLKGYLHEVTMGHVTIPVGALTLLEGIDILLAHDRTANLKALRGLFPVAKSHGPMLAGLSGDFPHFSYVFQERVDTLQTMADLLPLAYEDRTEQEEARGLLALLRQSLVDPACVAACARRLLATVRYLTPPEQDALATLLQDVDDANLDHPLARIYAEMGRHDLALVRVERALAHKPRDYQLLVFRARTLEWLGRPDED